MSLPHTLPRPIPLDERLAAVEQSLKELKLYLADLAMKYNQLLEIVKK